MNVRLGLGVYRFLDFWGNLLQSNGTFGVSEGMLEEDVWWSRSKTHQVADARVTVRRESLPKRVEMAGLLRLLFCVVRMWVYPKVWDI